MMIMVMLPVESRGRVNGTRDFSLGDGFGPPVPGIRHGNGSKEGCRIRVNRIFKDLVKRAHFNDLAQVHDGHPVTDVLAGDEIMGDESF